MAIGFYNPAPAVLPHALYPKATLRIVERAIAEAWRIIRDHPQGDFDIQTADEDRITLELTNCLMDNVLVSGVVDGFTDDLFVVGREGKFPSFDGAHLDKMPDLNIWIKRDVPQSLPSNDRLFVECKPVGRDHPVGVAYCNKGIARFVNGEYAWALTQGMMVGYASPGYTLPGKLRDAIGTRCAALRTTGNVQACPKGQAQGYTQQVCVTVHRRGFRYPHMRTKVPDITLRHLWLNRG